MNWVVVGAAAAAMGVVGSSSSKGRVRQSGRSDVRQSGKSDGARVESWRSQVAASGGRRASRGGGGAGRTGRGGEAKGSEERRSVRRGKSTVEMRARLERRGGVQKELERERWESGDGGWAKRRGR